MRTLGPLRNRISKQGTFLLFLCLVSFILGLINPTNTLLLFPGVTAFFGAKVAQGRCERLDRRIKKAKGTDDEEYY